MIIGIGCDIVNHTTTKELNWESDEKLLSRIFSPKEIDCFIKNKKLSYLAGRFAAKESVLKCLGTGLYDGISLNKIEILQLENGQPSVELKGESKKLSDRLGIVKWHVSISHSLDNSIAFVTAED